MIFVKFTVLPSFYVVIFIKRYDSNSGGEREIQRTMLELLNQLDGFDSRGDVKVCVFIVLQINIKKQLYLKYFMYMYLLSLNITFDL